MCNDVQGGLLAHLPFAFGAALEIAKKTREHIAKKTREHIAKKTREHIAKRLFEQKGPHLKCVSCHYIKITCTQLCV
jgi:hypothetical protein